MVVEPPDLWIIEVGYVEKAVGLIKEKIHRRAKLGM